MFPYHISDGSMVVVQIFFGIGAILGQFEHPQQRLWTDVRSADLPYLALQTMPTLPVPACRTCPCLRPQSKTLQGVSTASPLQHCSLLTFYSRGVADVLTCLLTGSAAITSRR